MAFGLAALAGATALSGVLGSRSASKAASAQQAAAEMGIEEQRRQFDLTRSDLAPYRDLGPQAIPYLSQLLGLSGTFDQNQITQRPGYQFGLSQGVNAMDRSASAAGLLGTGGYGKALTRYGQDYGQMGYDRELSRLSNIVGIGQSAANQTGAYGANAANQVSGLYGNIGDAQAGGYLGQSAALNNTVGGLGSLYFANQLFNNPNSGYWQMDAYGMPLNGMGARGPIR